MSVISMNFESQYLGSRHYISIILPDAPRNRDPRTFYPENNKFKVLWLLHGTYGDCTDWIRKTNIEIYAGEKNLVVIMPTALNSDYVNWKSFGLGFNMFDFLFEELMPMIYSWFPVSDKREDNYIAGLSMGGMGTMVYALNRPEKFAAAGSLSGPIMNPREPIPLVVPENHQVPSHLKDFRPVRRDNQISNPGNFDDYIASPANTWDKLVNNYADGVVMPKLYFCCGTDDFLYPPYVTFKKFAYDNGFDIVFEEEDGFKHEWSFWDKYIKRFLDLYIPD